MIGKDHNPEGPGGEEQLMMRYLLADLNEDEREEVSRRLFADEEFRASIEAMEAEILDRYVRGELTDEQKQRVEGRLLATEGQLEKLAFARAMQQSARARRSLGRASVRRWLAVAALAAAVVIALLLVRQRAPVEIARDVTPGTDPRRVVTVRLQPGVSRGPVDAAVVRLPDGSNGLSTQLVLEPGDEGHRYAAVVRSADGREMWKSDVSTSESEGRVHYCTLLVAAAAWPTGRYEIILYQVDGSQRKLLNSYWFELR